MTLNKCSIGGRSPALIPIRRPSSSQEAMSVPTEHPLRSPARRLTSALVEPGPDHVHLLHRDVVELLV